MLFEWDAVKEAINIGKHGVDFETAKETFFDALRITTVDDGHSTRTETRYFCFGRVGKKIMTVRFTIRKDKIRILGAGYWRKGREFYEKRNRIQR
jgi:uncharacterized DUF497 family protein